MADDNESTSPQSPELSDSELSDYDSNYELSDSDSDSDSESYETILSELRVLCRAQALRQRQAAEQRELELSAIKALTEKLPSGPMPCLPREIRRMIWRELAAATLPQSVVKNHIIIRSETEYEVVKHNEGDTFIIARAFADGHEYGQWNDSNSLFQTGAMNASPDLFREILADVADRIIFCFPGASSLAGFFDILCPYYVDMPDAVPRLRIQWPPYKNSTGKNFTQQLHFTINLLVEIRPTDGEAHEIEEANKIGGKIQRTKWKGKGVLDGKQSQWTPRMLDPEADIVETVQPRHILWAAKPKEERGYKYESYDEVDSHGFIELW
ncbi:hypothetical protein G7054_g8465 [Neopestalotiopsis clavispora]|nr:hypothetical protein G7054_g8465 [Neopestalotiopsis clavispora]